jgi:2-(1,2-epoxy-1,2-dihydrophenyl)acetyl-CoA isomerase
MNRAPREEVTQMPVIESVVESGVLTLTLNRPEKRNAVDSELRDALLAALAGAVGSGARCVVIRGAGPGFCAGADLAKLAPSPGVGIFELMRESSQRIVTTLQDCPLPVVASVHGAAAGIGFSIALAADVCLVADDARFIASFVHRSIVPDGAIGYLLPRVIGTARAKRFLMTGGTMSGRQAYELGIAAAVVDAEKLPEATAELAAELVALPTKALSFTKMLIDKGMTIDLETYLLLERAGQGVVSTTQDAAEGIAAFLEKRTPVFRGA